MHDAHQNIQIFTNTLRVHVENHQARLPMHTISKDGSNKRVQHKTHARTHTPRQDKHLPLNAVDSNARREV